MLTLRLKSHRHMTGLATRTTSAFGSCDYLPRRCCHLARIHLLAWPPLRRSRRPAIKGDDLGPPIPRRSRESKSSYDVRLCPWQTLHGEDDPLPDVEDNDDKHHTRATDSAGEGGRSPPGAGRVWPGTKESHSRSLAHLLKIQPGIHSTEDSSCKKASC